MRQLLLGILAAVTVISAPMVARPAVGQELSVALADGGPRFLLASPSAVVSLDVSRTPVLGRRIALDLEGVTLKEALVAISAEARLDLFYSDDVVPLDRRVRLRAQGITVAAALTDVLFGAGVDVVFRPEGGASLVRRVAPVRAQSGAVTGQVTDGKTGDGLPGAEVFLEGTRWRTAARDEGRYRLAEVEAGSYTLTVRRIGYGKRSQPVTVMEGQEVTADVALQPVPTRLAEVVTTATGEQRRLELGHVVGRINADSLVKAAPVSNLSELLTGRVPGLQVFQSQGTVGGEVHLQVRAPNSISLSTEPIVIVDGIRYTSQEGQAAVPGGVFFTEPTSRLNDLNPNDIETIEVVKGPSAATLYGTDAANGVVVVTTKRGRPGPARWHAYGRASGTAIPTPRFADNYWGWGTATSSCTLQGVAAGFCTQDSVTVLPNPLNDPALAIFRSKPRWESGANVSGGRQDLRYYFAGDFERATGPLQLPPAMADSIARFRGVSALPAEQLEPNALTRTNLRANVTALLGEQTELRVNAGYSRSATRNIRLQGNAYVGAWQATPTDPYGSSFLSPAGAFAQTSTENVDRFVGSASGQWRPAPWLVARATAGLDLTSSDRYSLARRGDVDATSAGQVGDDRARRVATTAELGATATFRAGRLRSRTAAGAQYVRNLTDALSSSGFDLPPGGASVGQAASTRLYQLYAETVTLGSYLEQTLGWNERLFLTGAFRVDGASAFGRDYAAAVYPKVSVSWLLSAEPWLPRLPGLDELRLRYAFGASGQQAVPYMTLPQYGAQPAFLDGAPTTAIALAGLGNPDLRPERVREHELGLDAAGLRGRVHLELTWYHRRTTDQIVSVNLPPGLGAIYTNLGRTRGRGFEAQLTARLLDTKAVSWDVVVQHSSQTTTLVALGGAAPNYTVDGGWVEGYPLGARFMRPLLGYADANGNGIIEPSEVQLGDTAVYMGPNTPPRAQTLTTAVGLFHQRLRLSALLERRGDFTQVNTLKVVNCFSHCRAVVDPRTPLAEQAEAAALQAPAVSAQPSAGFTLLEPGDFTRLREVTAAVDLPVGVARALRVGSATLALSARNLALWTAFSGPDPESAAVNGVAAGIPQGRSWTLRLDLGF